VAILANTRYQQGISCVGVAAVNFWEVSATAIGGILVDQPAGVLIRQPGSTATICLAGPRQNIATITVTWSRPVSAVTSNDASVTVLQTGSQLQLRFATGGTADRTHKATVTLA
jgi:hyaluronate lyase